MPIYVYQCQNCHKEIEKIQKFSDPPLETCDHCGGHLEKVLYPPAIHFKGTGWYVTDYARKNQPASNGQNRDKSTSDKKETGSSTSDEE